jgi:hypothetical protein
MLRQLKLKFVCINMLIVTVTLCGIFGTVLFFTARNLEIESIRAMEAIAARPMDAKLPDEPQEEVRLPYFCLEVDQAGQLTATGGGYFDLSDEDYLRGGAGCRLGGPRPHWRADGLQPAFLPGGDAAGAARGLH